ncbi:MBL fold metallo-hydrolase [Kouleothrix sp.]|uniref:MBL fold metallo-hydrolase n=1 Tax=Kouleothrix sp. TaxID=2779161 RepID=UPI00391A068B
MLRMTLLGVGTAVPDQDRENTHMVWEAPEGLLLIDAGGSTFQRILRAGLDPLALRGVFLTHSHTDHINGLPALIFQLALAGFQGSLPIYGNAPTIELVRRILDVFGLEQYKVPLEWVVVAGGQEVPLHSPSYRLRVADTVHPRPCLALRLEDRTSGSALVYSADTEPCPTVQDLARGASILIHEATTPQPFAGHTTPRQAGTVAATAQAGRLVLVHFSPRYTMSAADAIAEVHAGGFAGEAEIGREFGTYTL